MADPVREASDEFVGSALVMEREGPSVGWDCSVVPICVRLEEWMVSTAVAYSVDVSETTRVDVVC